MDASVVWGVIGVIIASVALVVAVMTIPTVFQMIWGEPTLRVSFRTQALADAPAIVVLWGELMNPLITNRLLKALRVRRTAAEDVLVHYQIRDVAGDAQVFQANPYLAPLYDVKAESQRTRIPPSDNPYVFRVVTVDTTTRTVFAIPKDGQKTVVPHGLYRVLVTATNEGKTYKKGARLVVQGHDPYAYWTAAETQE